MEGSRGPTSNMYLLKSAHYPGSLTAGLIGLLEDEDCSLTDVTLGCEGQFIQAHRVVLALSSPFFKEFFRINRMNNKAGNCLIVLANVKFGALKNLVQFMYHGKVSISNVELGSFLEAAKVLQIEGLTTELVPRTSAQNSDVTAPHPQGTAAHSRQSTSGSPTQRKRSRMTESDSLTSTTSSNNMPAVTSTFSLPPSPIVKTSSSTSAIHHQPVQNIISDAASANYDPLEDENSMNEDVEEMINLDAVKPERIEVYTSYDDPGDNADGLDSMGGTVGPGSSSNVGYSGYDEPTQRGSAPQQLSGHLSVMGHHSHLSTNLGSTSSSKAAKPGDEDNMNPKTTFIDSLFVTPPRNPTMLIRCKLCNRMMGQEEYCSLSHQCVQSACTGKVDPVSCPLCGRTFKNPNSLKVHKSTYHKKPREGLPPMNSGVRLNHLIEVYPRGTRSPTENQISSQQQQAMTALVRPSQTTTGESDINMYQQQCSYFISQPVPTLPDSSRHVSYPRGDGWKPPPAPTSSVSSIIRNNSDEERANDSTQQQTRQCKLEDNK